MMRTPDDSEAIYQMRLRSNERGMVLVLTLLAMVILVILGSVLVVTSLTEHQISSNDVAAVQALYVAEGGIQTVLNDLNKGGTGSIPSPVTVGPGQFTFSIVDFGPPTGQKRIEVTGYIPTQASPRAERRISVLVYPKSPFLWGAFGDNQLEMSNGGLTDSYDSDVGTYRATYNGVANVGSNGDVRSNGNVDLSGFGTHVHGDATAGTTVTDPWRVTGTATNSAPAVTLASVGCPAGGYTPDASVPSGTNINYDASRGDLTIAWRANVTLSSPGTYYFHNVVLFGDSTLTLSDSGHVDIYISGQLNCGGGTLVNPSGAPTNLTIWGCGTDTQGWTLSGTSQSAFAVYAPNHIVTISGGGALYGSIVGYEVKNTGGAFIHYDEALTRRPGIGKYMVAPRSWTELTP